MWLQVFRCVQVKALPGHVEKILTWRWVKVECEDEGEGDDSAIAGKRGRGRERGGVTSAYMYKHSFVSFGDTSTSAHIQ